jgi:hypothetical protein
MRDMLIHVNKIPILTITASAVHVWETCWWIGFFFYTYLRVPNTCTAEAVIVRIGIFFYMYNVSTCVSDTCTAEAVIVMNRNFVYMYQHVSATCTDEVSRSTSINDKISNGVLQLLHKIITNITINSNIQHACTINLNRSM